MIIEAKYKHSIYLITSLLLVRFITVFYFKISIDEKWLFGLWQHIGKEYLENNFFESILFFHAQPPVLNFILGLGVKISNILSLNVYVSLINFMFTLLILYSSHHLLKIFRFNRNLIYLILLFFIILSPSILFYENFPSYAHFTCALLFLIKLNFLKILKKFKLKYELQIYFYACLLILSWSAYVIYFNILIFFLLIPLSIQKKRFIKSLSIFLLFFIIGLSPSIKNKIMFDVFANSSWTGLNAAQATGYDREKWPLCSFNKDNLEKYNNDYKNLLSNKDYLNKKILNDKSYNDLGYIFKSVKCKKKSKEYLFLNFNEITKQKIKRFFSVHAHLSFDFSFKPNHWKDSFAILEKLNQDNLFKIVVLLFFITNYTFYLFTVTMSLYKRDKNFLNNFLIINFILYSYLLFVSFYGSTWEQERMRYTGYSFIFISVSLIIQKFLPTIMKFLAVRYQNKW